MQQLVHDTKQRVNAPEQRAAVEEAEAHMPQPSSSTSTHV
jgi:hypothetical protein